MTDLVPPTMKTKVLRPKNGEKDKDKDENWPGDNNEDWGGEGDDAKEWWQEWG